MTVERSWLLRDADEDDAKPEGAMWYEGWLVPDGRLETLADAQRCRHGKIDEHVTEYNPLKD